MSSRIAVIAPDTLRVRLHAGKTVAVPLDEIELRFSRSSGPGGQHAQKTETRVEAVFDVDASMTLTSAQKRRLTARAGAVVRAVAQEHRSQWRNRELALERLGDAIAAGLKVERKRRPTRPSPEARERRLGEKKRRGQTKRLRNPPGDEGD
jgi:ribosome-associated protein